MVRFFLHKLTVTYPDLAALVLRLGFGFMMSVNHGYVKLVHFHEWKTDFTRFMGLSGSLSLSLAIFAELACSILLILGLFTRLALFPLLVAMFVIFQSHNWDFLGEGELATSFLMGYLAILAIGPGRYSLDWLIGERLESKSELSSSV
ncbi:DoxX family protein [Spirosoma linguale]|uniref:DoxX family protein n=1 Tax=Spirosoma linguale (strain ATCC 33905 / DSM 74 / LMG 10896 / Claus 1) TaxID=504472 RepID=D2QHZ8_SPILD|nr:DoxX family protein [Spirosoma linguale DSM 74]